MFTLLYIAYTQYVLRAIAKKGVISIWRKILDVVNQTCLGCVTLFRVQRGAYCFDSIKVYKYPFSWIWDLFLATGLMLRSTTYFSKRGHARFCSTVDSRFTRYERFVVRPTTSLKAKTSLALAPMFQFDTQPLSSICDTIQDMRCICCK